MIPDDVERLKEWEGVGCGGEGVDPVDDLEMEGVGELG